MRKFDRRGDAVANALILILVAGVLIGLASMLASIAAIKGRNAIMREGLKKTAARVEAIESELTSRGYLAPTTK